ncbi:outer membrane beta-barrel protein [Vibrio fluvialis]|uniref:outer membrane protein n=1 Tax=Vibrio fluvialis TaxID=676 RepID=UPI001C9C365D|nr:outer membrane beta-barrel protein [Vibrio fluvialis]ELM6620692.1 outer membrane beta-barrel protein [Vibrio fluvialis]MBY8156934.1 porin family protein [Vibrio fluvialis]MBY8271501.1 porin family protein [Vibrio fluvialis]MCG6369054.1 porin family protein [Vibrio fluvialis]MCG6376221.1 porin family protein [Vibrio fluvialis]
MKKSIAVGVILSMASVSTIANAGLLENLQENKFEVTAGKADLNIGNIKTEGYSLGFSTELYPANVDGLSLRLDSRISKLDASRQEIYNDQMVGGGYADFKDDYELEAMDYRLGFSLGWDAISNDVGIITPYVTAGFNRLTVDAKLHQENLDYGAHYNFSDSDSSFGVYYGVGLKTVVSDHFVAKVEYTGTTASVFDADVDRQLNLDIGYRF